jgi:hypothetical protein
MPKALYGINIDYRREKFVFSMITDEVLPLQGHNQGGETAFLLSELSEIKGIR